MHSALRVFLGLPAILGDLVHHHVLPSVEELRHTRRVDQLRQAESILGPLSRRGARHHPEPRVGLHQRVQHLPALALGVLVVAGLVHDDEVVARGSDVLFDDLNTVVVDDEEVGLPGDNLSALVRGAVSNAHRAVHGKGEQVCVPRTVHDRERADDQSPLDDALLHEEVRSPDRAGRLARPRLVEAERLLVHGQKGRRRALMRHRSELARPAVAALDG